MAIGIFTHILLSKDSSFGREDMLLLILSLFRTIVKLQYSKFYTVGRSYLKIHKGLLASKKVLLVSRKHT